MFRTPVVVVHESVFHFSNAVVTACEVGKAADAPLADELSDGQRAAAEASSSALSDTDEVYVLGLQRIDLAQDLLGFRAIAGRDNLRGDRADLAGEEICDSVLLRGRGAR